MRTIHPLEVINSVRASRGLQVDRTDTAYVEHHDVVTGDDPLPVPDDEEEEELPPAAEGLPAARSPRPRSREVPAPAEYICTDLKTARFMGYELELSPPEVEQLRELLGRAVVRTLSRQIANVQGLLPALRPKKGRKREDRTDVGGGGEG